MSKRIISSVNTQFNLTENVEKHGAVVAIRMPPIPPQRVSYLDHKHDQSSIVRVKHLGIDLVIEI
ncbi:MAG TPA: hypothetical protein VK856_13215 [Anaerolineaceae bacterium]|nr:hypothetical protein [Anaerolineaceae bacterium]